MIHLQLLIAILVSIAVVGTMLVWPRKKINHVPDGPHVNLNAKCPACGHFGCKASFIPAAVFEVGEKREERTAKPMVARTCNTCGAIAYEDCVLPPEKWILK
jgi:hypothetical protein